MASAAPMPAPSVGDLVSLEDTPLAMEPTSGNSNIDPDTSSSSLLDDMGFEQSQLDTPSLSAKGSEETDSTDNKPQRKSVDFHPSVMDTKSPLSPRHVKRQSLSFPVNVTPSYYPSTHYSQLRSPQHVRTSSEVLPSPVVENVEPASDPMGFLTVLAGQERRVLELKEELLRADAELEKLKRKWAMHEATRKRTDSSTVEQMRSLEQADETKKHARRQSVGVSHKSKRTTFHNTKHQRTLSLLSPDRTNFQSFPQPADVDEPLKPKRASTMKDHAHTPFLYEGGYEKSLYEPANNNNRKINHQDALIATGKQMAEDFRDGLWTFIEDLRQATVGEEMTANGQKQSTPTTTPLKKKGSKASLKITPIQTPSTVKPKPKRSKSTPKATKLVDIGDDFWSEMDPDGPLSAKPKDEEEIDYFKEPALSTYKKGHVKPESVRWSTSTIVSEMGSGAMSPGAYSTPRTSTSLESRSSSPQRRLSEPFAERNAAELIQQLADSHQQQSWASLVAPLGKLQRTATTVLTQIEKGLAPPPASQSSYYDLENARSLVTYDKSKRH